MKRKGPFGKGTVLARRSMKAMKAMKSILKSPKSKSKPAAKKIAKAKPATHAPLKKGNLARLGEMSLKDKVKENCWRKWRWSWSSHGPERNYEQWREDKGLEQTQQALAKSGKWRRKRGVPECIQERQRSPDSSLADEEWFPQVLHCGQNCLTWKSAHKDWEMAVKMKPLKNGGKMTWTNT